VIAVFPWLPGITLEQRLTTEISPPERARIAIALAGAVRAMHAEKIVHVDLSPHQVMVHTFRNKEGMPIVFTQLIDLDAAIVDGETTRGKILGKVGYASPEHFLKDATKVVSYPSDVFTLGLMLLHVLLGVHPYDAYTASRVAYREAIAKGYFRIPAGGYDRAVIEILVSCLSREPKLRPDAKRVHQTLLELREGREVFPERRWAGQTGLARTYVQLTRPDASPPFRRIYYDGVKLSGQELRGSGLPGRLPTPCELRSEGTAWLIKRLHKDVPVSVDGRKLRLGGAAHLKETQTVTIAAQPFVVSVHIYNVAIKTPKAPILAKPQPKKPAPATPGPAKLATVRPAPASLVVKTPAAPVVPTAGIAAVRIDHNVMHGGETGMRITVDFWLHGLKGARVWVGAWIEVSSGENLKDLDGSYRDGDGNVATIYELAPERDVQTYAGYVLFMPVAQLHLARGAHELRLCVRILRLIAPDRAGELARSDFVPIRATIS